MVAVQRGSEPAFEHSHKRQFRLINVVYVLIMGLGSIAYGYSASVISTTLVQPGFINSMKLAERTNAKDLIGLTGSLYQAGGLLGTFTTSYFADRWGRRVGIAVPTAVSVVAAACLTGSVNIEMFIAFRFFAGGAAYSLVAAVPIWMSEVAPPNVRGILVDLHALLLLIGYLLAACLGYAFWKLDTSTAWRGHQAVAIIPAVLLLAALPFLPESPRWLLMNHRKEEAASVLKRLHTTEEAEVELLQIERQVEIDRTLPSSYLALIKKPSYRKRAILAYGTVTCIQMTGPLGKLTDCLPECLTGLLTSPPRSLEQLRPNDIRRTWLWAGYAIHLPNRLACNRMRWWICCSDICRAFLSPQAHGFRYPSLSNLSCM